MAGSQQHGPVLAIATWAMEQKPELDASLISVHAMAPSAIVTAVHCVVGRENIAVHAASQFKPPSVTTSPDASLAVSTATSVPASGVGAGPHDTAPSPMAEMVSFAGIRSRRVIERDRSTVLPPLRA